MTFLHWTENQKNVSVIYFHFSAILTKKPFGFRKRHLSELIRTASKWSQIITYRYNIQKSGDYKLYLIIIDHVFFTCITYRAFPTFPTDARSTCWAVVHQHTRIANSVPTWPVHVSMFMLLCTKVTKVFIMQWGTGEKHLLLKVVVWW